MCRTRSSAPAPHEFWAVARLLRAMRARLAYMRRAQQEQLRLADAARRAALQQMASTVETESGAAMTRVAAGPTRWRASDRHGGAAERVGALAGEVSLAAAAPWPTRSRSARPLSN